jgi:hypothetical protein
MATRKRVASKIYELYVELEDIEPLIWRRLLVLATITLPNLHDLLQLAMGWTDSHLHSFTFRKKAFGMADVDARVVHFSSDKLTSNGPQGRRGRDALFLSPACL